MKYSFSHPNRLTKHFYSLSFPSSIDNSNDSLFTQIIKLNNEENKRKNNKLNINLIHFKTIYQKGIPCKKIRELIDFKNSSIITDNKIQKKTKYPLLMKNYFSFNQNKSKDKFNYLFISKSHKKGLNLKKNKKENHNNGGQQYLPGLGPHLRPPGCTGDGHQRCRPRIHHLGRHFFPLLRGMGLLYGR